MSETTRLFQALSRAQDCLPHPVPWPDGILAHAGLSSRSVQVYGRFWALQAALATTIHASLAAAGPRPRVYRSLPLARWRECAAWLAKALVLAQAHARHCGHVSVLGPLSMSSATLGVLGAQLQQLETLSAA